ncbi:MAG: hypothetical protein FWB72_04680 [Firmicutes bacterium]|nr:hypothetical protein [Bacillota bacterium]
MNEEKLKQIIKGGAESAYEKGAEVPDMSAKIKQLAKSATEIAISKDTNTSIYSLQSVSTHKQTYQHNYNNNVQQPKVSQAPYTDNSNTGMNSLKNRFIALATAAAIILTISLSVFIPLALNGGGGGNGTLPGLPAFVRPINPDGSLNLGAFRRNLTAEEAVTIATNWQQLVAGESSPESVGVQQADAIKPIATSAEQNISFIPNRFSHLGAFRATDSVIRSGANHYSEEELNILTDGVNGHVQQHRYSKWNDGISSTSTFDRTLYLYGGVEYEIATSHIYGVDEPRKYVVFGMWNSLTIFGIYELDFNMLEYLTLNDPFVDNFYVTRRQYENGSRIVFSWQGRRPIYFYDQIVDWEQYKSEVDFVFDSEGRLTRFVNNRLWETFDGFDEREMLVFWGEEVDVPTPADITQFVKPPANFDAGGWHLQISNIEPWEFLKSFSWMTGAIPPQKEITFNVGQMISITSLNYYHMWDGNNLSGHISWARTTYKIDNTSIVRQLNLGDYNSATLELIAVGTFTITFTSILNPNVNASIIITVV